MPAQIVGRALAKDIYVDGWMALTGWDLNAMTADEVEEAEALELEAVTACQESLCSMGSGVEECIGEAISVQVKSVTWDQLVSEALRCPLYQGLVSAVLCGEDAPSQPKEPPVPLLRVEYPFQ